METVIVKLTKEQAASGARGIRTCIRVLQESFEDYPNEARAASAAHGTTPEAELALLASVESVLEGAA